MCFHTWDISFAAVQLFPECVRRRTRDSVGSDYLRAALWAVRVLVKTVYDVSIDTFNARPAIIFGVDECGMGLAKLVRNDKSLRMRLFGFMSNGNEVRHKVLMGLHVYSYDDVERLIHQKKMECLLVSQSSVGVFRNDKTLQDLLIANGVHIFMPRTNEEWNLAAPDATLKEVSIEDLLPRDEISIDLKSVADTLHGKCILVTGSAGSIGSEIVSNSVSSIRANWCSSTVPRLRSTTYA